MSKHARWKSLERRHAKRFVGGQRLWRPDYGESAPDGESPTEVWDCKAYQRFSVVRMFVECEAKYKAWAGGRNFHLCLSDGSVRGDYVVVRSERYAELVECERRHLAGSDSRRDGGGA